MALSSMNDNVGEIRFQSGRSHISSGGSILIDSGKSAKSSSGVITIKTAPGKSIGNSGAQYLRTGNVGDGNSGKLSISIREGLYVGDALINGGPSHGQIGSHLKLRIAKTSMQTGGALFFQSGSSNQNAGGQISIRNAHVRYVAYYVHLNQLTIALGIPSLPS